MDIKQLETKLGEAKIAYYNDDPIMTDGEYDLLADELYQLNPDSKVLTDIGAPATSEWVKVKHLHPMGSLNKVNTPEEMTTWIMDKIDGQGVLVAEKLDGISLGCQYKDGNLIASATRGDGLIGEDILSNAIKMHGAIKTLKSKFSGTIRGEIILTKTNHVKWFKEYANPRNAASGISRRFDGDGSEHLTLMMYDAIGDEEFATEYDKFRFLETNGFAVPNYKLCTSAADVNAMWQEYQDKTRLSLDYEIDGLVVNCNNTKLQLSLGSHNLRSKGKLAFKFANQFIKTTVKEIRWNVGSSGHFTPVCWFEPVSILGSTIEKASVYNAAYIKKLGIGVGAEVLVCKANEIIPRCERVIVPADEVASPPDFCPSCDTKTQMQGEYLICPNYDCKPQVVGRIARWVGELNILELGDTLIEKLVDAKLVKTPADLYTLSVEQLAKIDRMGKKSAFNVYQSIWKCNPISLDLFLGSLSIPLIGSAMIRMVMEAGYETLEDIRGMCQKDIEAIHGFGVGQKALALYNGLISNETLIDQLLTNGVKIKKNVKMEVASNKLDQLSFVFTGKSSLPRKELQALVIANGGTTPSSVSKTTSHLVVADPDSGSSKIKKAEALGTKVISEAEFMAMIG